VTDTVEKMGSGWICVRSAERRMGKTHLLAAIGRWLSRAGRNVTPLHIVEKQPEGGMSRDVALLALACGHGLESSYEAARPDALRELARLQQSSDLVLVELHGPALDLGPHGIHLDITGRGVRGRMKLQSSDGLEHTAASWTGGEITEEEDPELLALPRWTPKSGPRVGVISLPHRDEFEGYGALRGAEWMTVGLPGRFDYVVIPGCTSTGSDREWLTLQGLDSWLLGQAEQGCRILHGDGAPVELGERFEPGSLRDHKRVSRILGRRIDAPLPDEGKLDELADWLDKWAGDGLLTKWVEAARVN
jgi:hypothetical protein